LIDPDGSKNVQYSDVSEMHMDFHMCLPDMFENTPGYFDQPDFVTPLVPPCRINHGENTSGLQKTTICTDKPFFARVKSDLSKVSVPFNSIILQITTKKHSPQLWPFISYNWLVLWDYTFYTWGFLSTYNWYFGP